jgi:hypothetical protein
VVLSARAPPFRPEDSLDVAELLPKPFELDTFLAAVARHCPTVSAVAPAWLTPGAAAPGAAGGSRAPDPPRGGRAPRPQRPPLLLALVPLAAAAADPVPLQPEQSGQLTGNRGGAFAVYRFFYPGDGDVALELRVRQPSAQAVGMRLYGPAGEVAEKKPRQRGDYTVQVYNYDPLLTADYTLTATGLPTPTAAAPPPARPTATPDASAPEDLTGTLPPGGSQGRFALFEFDYPGDGSAYVIKLHVLPDRRDVTDKAGFKVYAPNGRLLLTGGAVPGQRPNVVADFSSRETGTYTVQVYNYGDVPIEYDVSLQAS